MGVIAQPFALQQRTGAQTDALTDVVNNCLLWDPVSARRWWLFNNILHIDQLFPNQLL